MSYVREIYAHCYCVLFTTPFELEEYFKKERERRKKTLKTKAKLKK